MKNNYIDLRSTIKSGDILVWTNRKIEKISDITLQVIRLFTKSDYTHVGIAWVVEDRIFVIDAVMPVVRIYPLSRLLPFYLIQTNVNWNKEVENFALSTIGEKYSIKQAILSLVNKPNLDDNWQCAELVHEILMKCNIDLGESYTPSDIVYNALKNSYNLKLVDV